MTDARPASGTSSAMSSCARARLTASRTGGRLGLALLERRGVAAWARAWQTTAPARPCAASETAGVPGRPPARRELVGVLAAMALARLAAG